MKGLNDYNRALIFSYLKYLILKKIMSSRINAFPIYKY